MAENHDFHALEWVKGEIEETLKQAQQALEAFVENPEDSSRMRFCMAYLHQVYGTLQMLEFHGAALLAEELEKLALALLNHQTAHPQDAQEVLMRAMLQLPAYLDRVQAGRRDMPVVILPILNDLRAARGESLLSETALFKPDLVAGSEAVPSEAVSADALAQLPELLKKIRQLFQFALVGLIRNQDLPTNLGYMAKSLAKLEHLYSGTPMAQLWWVASAVVEGVSRNEIEAGMSIKMLFGNLDRQLKTSIESQAERHEAVPMDLLKNLLYYLARCESTSPRIQKVKEAFRLDSALPSEELLDTERRRMSGPDKSAMVSVVSALLDELGSVKDTLDLFMRGQHQGVASLKPVIPTLKQVADTLAVLGVGSPRRVIMEQIDILSRMVGSSTLPADNALMDVAGALLYVEASLQGMAEDSAHSATPAPQQAETGGIVSPEHVNKARAAVVEESRSGLELAKDAISEYVSSGFAINKLESVPDILHSVRGGLQMVPLRFPAALLESCIQYIREQLIDAQVKPDWKQLDALADAITSVDYYLERMGDSLSGDEDILAIAEDAVAALGYPAERVTVQDLAPTLSVVVETTTAEPEIAAPEETFEFEAPEEEPAEITLEAEQEDDDILLFTEDDLAAVEPAPVTPPTAVTPEPLPEEDDDLIDEEVIEIFVEEAGEVLETINDYLPQWKSDTDGEPALKELRRAYHTLKGSGRMVGATIVGELAWSIENMLNRVLDKTVAPSAAVIGIVETVTGVVPSLVKSFETRTRHTINVDALAAVADALAKNQTPPALPVDLSLDAAPQAEPEAAPEIVDDIPVIDELVPTLAEEIPEAPEETLVASTEGSEIDPILVEIFSQEASTHLQTIRDFLDQTVENEPLTENLLRALHTLKGSAHMAGITPIAELASPIERFIKECHSQGVMADSQIRLLLDDVVNLVEQGLVDLKAHPSQPLYGADHVLACIDELRDSRLKHVQEARPASGTPDPKLVSLFLAEGMDLIVDAGDVLHHWETNPVPGAELDNLRQELRILARSASAAQLPEVVTLSMALEELYNAAAVGMITPNADFFRTAHKAHEELINMMDCIAAAQPLPNADAIVAELQVLMDQAPEVGEQLSQAQHQFAPQEDDSRVITPEETPVIFDFGAAEIEDEAAIEDTGFNLDEVEGIEEIPAEELPVAEALPQEESEETAAEFSSEEFVLESAEDAQLESDYSEFDSLEEEQQIAATPQEQRSDFDPELVEIFLEEAGEIMDSTANLLQAWIDSPEDLDTVAALQRDLHTLKGGARMSDMREIGDLSHQLEDLYEGVCLHRFVATPALFNLLNQCHDRLAVMFEKVQGGQAPAPAHDLIGKIQDFMHGRLTTEEAPVPTPVSEEAPAPVAETPAGSFRVESQPVLAANDSEALQALSGEGIDTEILEIFLEEAEELSEGIDNTINAWLVERDNPEHLDEMKRLLHTLKGGARLAGLMHIGNLSHYFETFLIQAETDQVPQDDAYFARVQQEQDKLFTQLEHLRKHGGELITAQEDAEPKAPAPAMEDAAPAAAAEASDNVVPIVAQPLPQDVEIPALLPASAFHVDEPRRSSNESVKVPADLMENLVNLAGETSIIRGRIEQQITDFGTVIHDISMTIDRARELLRRLDMETEAQILYRHQQTAVDGGTDYEDFDPLEMDRYSTLNQLSRSLGETISDMTDLRDSLMDRSRDTETLLVQQGRINTELQESLMRSRMVPFSRMAPRLRRIVRQVADELGKKADLEIVGAEGEMDRTVLERMMAPLEHMLRNAVDHGIELPEERAAKGKKEQGRITIHLAREGGEVVLRLTDDGKGIALEKVKQRAIDRNLMKSDAPLSDKEILQFIFKPGFSTAEKVTQISGRGVGMDVVHSEIKQLGGTVKLHSAPGAGSQFTVRLPFTVSVNRALMVRVSEDLYAIPLNNIEGIVRVSPYELEAYYAPDAPKFEYAGQSYNMRYLGRYVHNIPVPNLGAGTRPLPVLLVRGGEHTVALQVDALVGSREIVVKSVGPQLAAVSGISGATILGDGSVVIILDLGAVIRADQAQFSRQEAALAAAQKLVPATRINETPLVMVVDDSVTVRKVTSRLLERNGYDVVTAKDGVDAITQLQDCKPDVMLLDIEMPRMDGFEVATLVRHDDRLKDTPIIMITSRTGEKHRERAMSIGVNRYLGKPYQETVLLQNIEELIRQER